MTILSLLGMDLQRWISCPIVLHTKLTELPMLPWLVDDTSIPGKYSITLAPVEITIDGIDIKIGAGFYTDKGSVPRILRTVADKAGASTLGYVVHDYITRKDVPYEISKIPKLGTDILLYRISMMCGESQSRAVCALLGTVIGGYFAKYFRTKPAVFYTVPDYVIHNITHEAVLTEQEYNQIA